MTKRMGIWIVVGVLLVGLAAYAACRVSGESREAETVSATPVPVETPQTTPEPWVRYPVPMDDDLQKYVIETCRRYDISPCIIFAQIGVESRYDPTVIGDNGDSYGLMQINRQWHEARMERLGVMDLLNPYQNVLVGIDLMAELLGYGKGMDYALSYYNGHGGNPCEYARIVQQNAECILEGASLQT